jgi:hypothetical protein
MTRGIKERMAGHTRALTDCPPAMNQQTDPGFAGTCRELRGSAGKVNFRTYRSNKLVVK